MKISSKVRSRVGVSVLSTGFNVALLAACNPALAHGGYVQNLQTGWAHYQPSQSQSAGGISQHFGASTAQGLIHPRGANSALASSFSIGSTQNSLAKAGAVRLLSLPPVPGSAVVSMDLTSSNKSIVLKAGLLTGSSTVTILVGNTNKTFQSGDSVTPAELVAICQMQGGAQTIVLDRNGRADGGSFSLNSLLLSGVPLQISELVVPKNVSALDYLSANSNIKLSGDLLNYGSIIDLSKGAQSVSANFSALDIVNERTGLITTNNAGGSGGSGTVDLALTAAKDFTNLGAVSSSGTLAIFAGGNLANGSTISGAGANNAIVSSASIKASGDVSLQSTTIVNSGLVSSSNGNINLGTGAGASGNQTLNVNNTNGTISALNGAINIREAGYSGTGNANISGGNLLSQALNLSAGAGTINVNVDELTGTVNSSGNAVHVEARTQNLVLGAQNLSGDPTFYNGSGSISITSDITVSEDLAIIASGNITSTAPSIITAVDGTGQGRNIFLIAGAAVTGAGGDTTSTIPGKQATGVVSISGASAGGGDINLAATSISSDSSSGNLNGGNITMAAFATGANGGHINIPAGVFDAAGFGSGLPGDISLIAGAASGTAISLNNIQTVNHLQLLNYQPVIVGGPMQFNTDGSVKAGSGSIQADFTKAGGGDINLNGVGLIAAFNVNISAGGSVSIGQVNPGSNPNATAVTITAGGNINTAAAAIFVGNSGNINLVAGGNIVGTNSDLGIGVLFPNMQTVSNITIVAGAAFTQDGNQITITGASNKASGNIDFSAMNSFIAGIGVEGSTTSGGANVTLAAFGGTGGAGQILFGGADINSNGFGTGANGAITLVAGGTISNVGPNAFVQASGGLSGTGSVNISTTNPLATASSPVLVSLSPGVANTGSFLGGQIGQNSTSNFGPIFLDNGNLTLVQGQSFTISGPLVTGSINSLVLQTLLNVNIQSDISVNGNLAIIAGGNITATNAVNNIASGGGTLGGSILLAAGAQSSVSTNSSSVANFSGASSTGGDINFSASALAISALGTGTSNGGNITLLAFGNAGSAVGGGHVLLPNSFIDASSTGATPGDVMVIAGNLNVLSPYTAVDIGNIRAQSGPSAGANNASISNFQPLVTNGPLQLGSNGQVVQGTITPDFTSRGGGDIKIENDFIVAGNAQVSAGGSATITTTSSVRAQTVTVTASQNITFADVIAPGGIVLIAGGSLLQAQAGGNITSSATVSGTSAGNILIVSGAAFTEDSTSIKVTGGSNQASSNIFDNTNVPANIFANGNNSAGGNITLVSFGNATTGQILLGSTPVSTSGVGGDNGNITLISGFQQAGGISSGGVLSVTGGNSGSGNMTISYSSPNGSAASPVVIEKDNGNLTGSFLGGQVVAASSNALSAPTLDGGNLTIVQGADIFVTSTPFATGNVNTLTLESGHNIIVQSGIDANAVTLLAGNSINLENGTNFSNEGGVTLIASRNIATVGASNVVIDTSNVNGGGAITIIAGAAFSLGDGQITVTGPSATGGLIDFTTGGNVTTFNSQGIGAGTSGGNITLLAFTGSDNNGYITLPSALTVTTFGDVASNGSFTLAAGSTIANSVIGNVTTSDAGAGSNPASFSGTINLSTYAPGITSNQPLVVLTNGFIISPNQIPLGTTGSATLIANTLTANSGTIIINASQNVQLGSVDVSAIPNSGQMGGSINITTNGSAQLVIGSNATSNFIFSLSSSGDTAGASPVNGSISLANLDPSRSGTAGIQLANTTAIQQLGASGSLSLTTSPTAGDTIDLGANTSINLSGLNATSPDGGSITLIGSSIVWNGMGTGTQLLLKANGLVSGGNGGSITYETASASPLVFSSTSPVQVSAMGGLNSQSGSGNGGTLTIENAGNIVYNSKSFDPVFSGKNFGNGGNLFLEAGYFDEAPIGAGNSSLLVTGNLFLNAQANDAGGTVRLLSNTTVPFNVGLIKGNTNGVMGSIDVVGPASNGTIIVSNNNGSVIISTPLTKVSEIDLSGLGPAGYVSLASSIGGSQTALIGIVANGNVSATSSKATITADNVELFANGNGAIGGASPLNVNAATLAASAQSDVNVIDSSATAVTLSGSSANGNFTVSVPTASLMIASNQQIKAFANVNLSTLGNINLGTESLIKSSLGNISITATTGNIKAQPLSDLSTSGSVQLNAKLGTITLNNVGGNGSPLSIALTAGIGITLDTGLSAVNSISLNTSAKTAGQGSIDLTNSNISTTSPTGTISIVSTIGDINAGFSTISAAAGVSLSAPAGGITAAALTSIGGKGTVSVNAIKAISITGDVMAFNAVTIKTLGSITLGGSVSVFPLLGAISITSLAGSISALPGSTISGSANLTIAAPGGSISVGNVGNVLTGSVSLSALNNVTAFDDLLATNLISVKSGIGQVTLLGNVNALSPVFGVVTIIATGAVGGSAIFVPIDSIIGSKSVTLTAPLGSVNIFGIGTNAMPSNTISITGGEGINSVGSLLAVNSLTLKTTDVTPGNGDIFVTGVANAISSAGIVSITAAGSQGIIAGGDVSAGKSVTMTAKQGNVTYGSVGLNVSTPNVTITALNDINMGLTQVTGAVSATALAKTGADGLVNVGPGIDATGAASTVTLIGNNMGVASGSSADISAGKSVTLEAPGSSGNVTVESIGLVNVPGTATITAGNSVSIQNNVTAGTGISIQSTINASGTGISIAPLANLTTQNGAIKLLSASSIQIGTSSAITANSTAKSGKAAVTIESANKTAGTISFGGNTSVTTFGPGGGNITVSIGAPKLVPGTNPNPGTISVSGTPGSVFFGPLGLINGAASAGKIFLQGANVIFSGTSAKAGAIQFVNTTFTADPPLTASGITASASGFSPSQDPQTPQLLNAPPQVLGNASGFQFVSAAASTAGSTVSGNNLFANSASNTLSVPILQALQSGGSQGELGAITSLAAGIESSGLQTSSLQGFAEVTATPKGQICWISDTEIDGGEIPVTLLGDGDLEIGGADLADLQIATGLGAANLPTVSGAPGAVTSARPAKIASLAKGSVLTLSAKDTVVKTPFGDVKIAGKSLALVMAWKHGLAVYNFDDRHQDSVVVSTAGKQVSIRPGTSAVIVADSVQAFEHINPAQLVAYRRTTEQQLDQGLKAYRSEFSMQTAIAALKPLRAMIVSNQKETRTVVDHFLKTTVIMMQLQSGGENFRQVLRPEITASR